MITFKILRNTTLFATREAALSDIATRAESMGDGELMLSTYGENPNAKTLLVIKRTDGVTIFDMEAISDDIASQIQEAIERLNLATIASSGLASDAATTPITASSSTVGVTGNNAADQIASLATTLKSVQDNASKYKMVQLTSAEVAALSDANVKEAYKVVSFQGEETAQTAYTQVGDVVKIYKDSALQEVYLGADNDSVNATTGTVTKNTVTDPQSMNFVYQLADGTYSMTKIDVSKFLSESEFGDGLQVVNGQVSVKINTTSADAENFLSVDSDGIMISGVADAIVDAISEVDERILENERVIAESLNDLELRKAEKVDMLDLGDTILERIVAGNGIEVTQKANKTQTVSVKLKDDPNNALTLDANGLCLTTLDCGTY